MRIRKKNMTTDFVTTTIYGHTESFNRRILPFISEGALNRAPSRFRRTRKVREMIAAEMNSAQLRHLLRDEAHAPTLVNLLVSARSSGESTAHDALLFELGYLAGKLDLLHPAGL